METNIQTYYSVSDDFRRYIPTHQNRVNELGKIIRLNHKYFGKRVLDLMCGGGVLGVLLEPLGKQYVGVDLNINMIKNAKNYAVRTKSKNKFILTDAVSYKSKNKFDTIAILGNALMHIGTRELVKILENVKTYTSKGAFFIIDYRDLVYMLAEKQWKDKYVKKQNGRTVVSRHSGENVVDGYLIRKAQDLSTKRKVKFTHYIWSPFIIEPLMNSNGWELVKRTKNKQWPGWLDVYKRT